ncbi:MAG: CAP domain-containing protein [Candidatus Nanopelagicales bacterium]
MFRKTMSVSLLAALLLVTGAPLPVQAKSATATAREKATVKLINQARGKARNCGGARYPAVKKVTVSKQLTYAARHHAADMGKKGYFAHESPNGNGPGQRVTAAGFKWTTVGEAIAAGPRTPEAVVAAWLNSPDHCEIIMDSSFRNIGLGYRKVAGSRYGTYWVADFGTRR